MVDIWYIHNIDSGRGGAHSDPPIMTRSRILKKNKCTETKITSRNEQSFHCFSNSGPYRLNIPWQKSSLSPGRNSTFSTDIAVSTFTTPKVKSSQKITIQSLPSGDGIYCLVYLFNIKVVFKSWLQIFHCGLVQTSVVDKKERAYPRR